MRKSSRLPRSDIAWSMAVIALIVLQFWWLPGEKGQTTDSYSTTVDGQLGFYRTLKELFPEVSRQNQWLCPERTATLLVLAPDRYPSDSEQQQLYDFVSGGGTLLFAPNWNLESCQLPTLGIDLQTRFFIKTSTLTPAATNSTPPPQAAGPEASAAPDVAGDSTGAAAPEHTAEAAADAPAASQTVPAELPDDSEADSEAAREPLQTPPTAGLPLDPAAGPPASNAATPPTTAPYLDAEHVTVSGSLVTGAPEWRTRSRLELPARWDSEVLVESESGPEVASWPLGRGRVLVCSSPDVFSNRSLLFADSRRLAVRLVEHLHQHHHTDAQPSAELTLAGAAVPLVVSEYLNASDAYRQTGVLFSPALRSGTLQLSLLAVLALWYGFHRFGPARLTRRAQRRSLTDSARAVGNLQYGLRDGGTVVRGYLEYLRSQLRRRYGGAVRLEQTDALAARTGLPVEELRMQLADAERLAAAPAVPPARAAATLRWLSELHERLSRTSG